MGPIKYVAQQVNRSVDTVVNWFILLFIFVFDPLAVMLLISATRLIKSKRNPVIEEERDNAHDVVSDLSEDGLNDIFADIDVYDSYVDRQEPSHEDIYDEEEVTKEKPKRVILRSEIK